MLFRSKASGEDDDVRALDGDACGAGKLRDVVADDRLEGYGDAEVVETCGEIERVRVLSEWSQHLGADSDDFCDHDFFWDSGLLLDLSLNQ